MLFSGKACFSPSVAPALRKGWVKNGGELTHSTEDFYQASYFFCNDLDDPWLSELLSRSLVVRHASWVSACISEQFLMPVAPYTLDDHFDPSAIGISAPVFTPDTPDTSDSKPSIGSTITSVSNLKALILPCSFPARKTLKRTFVEREEDDSYLDIDPRSSKKPRIQEPPCPHLALQIQGGGTNTVATISEVSQARVTHMSEDATATSDFSKPFDQRYPAEPSRRVYIPTLTSLLKLTKKKPFKRPIFKRESIDPFSNQSRLVKSLPSSFAYNSFLSAVLPILTAIHFPDRSSADDKHGTFWTRTRQEYVGFGPLLLSMDDLLSAKGPLTDAMLFTPNGIYRGEKFGFFWR